MFRKLEIAREKMQGFTLNSNVWDAFKVNILTWNKFKLEICLNMLE